ncbi:MAG: alpha/beta hydrolase [Firmicutes bacterium]|nr:alpha/beta hydrolase [Bacillota bacterium]
METFFFRGWPIRYKLAGKGAPVILLHNGGASHAIWNDIVPLLSGEFELFAFDLLGYGASAKPGTGYTLTGYIDFLNEFINHRRLAPVNLVGNCMGSAMSLGLAMRRPEYVRALVLINPLTEATFLGGIMGPLLRMQKRAPRFSRRINQRLARVKLTPRLGSLALRFQLGAHGKSRRIHKRPELCSCYASPGQMDSLLGVLEDLSNYGYLDRFEPGPGFPPVCTIWGLQNRILSPEAGRLLNAGLKPLRQEWLEGCGHLLMLERPEEVALIIREFFGRAHHENGAAPGTEEG